MATEKKNQSTMKKALIIGVLSSTTTGISAVIGGSVTQYVDFGRRFLEFISTLVAFVVYRKLSKNPDIPADKQAAIQWRACLITSIVMICSGLLLSLVSILSFSTDAQHGNLIPGYIVAILGVLINLYFCISYYRSLQKEKDPIIKSQFQMFRAKTGVDFCVVFTLSCFIFVPNWTLLPWIDLCGSLIVAIFLFVEGIRNYKQTKRGDTL